MGERPDDRVAPVASDSSSTSSNAEPVDATTEQIKAEIEETRSQMSDTIEAIQDRLSPTRALERAKDSVYDATVGRVKSAVGSTSSSAGSGTASSSSSRLSSTRDAASAAFDRVKDNPIPFALLGVGLAWMALRSRSDDDRERDVDPDYAWTEPQWQAESAYGTRSRSQGLWDAILEHPIPVAVTAVSLGLLANRLRARTEDDWAYVGSDDYTSADAYAGPGSYASSSSFGSTASYRDADLYDDASIRGSDYAPAYGSAASFDTATYGEPLSDTGVRGTEAEGEGVTGRLAKRGSEALDAARENARTTWERSQGVGRQVSGNVRDAARRGGERVSEIASQAGEKAAQAGEVVRDAARRGGQQLGAIAGQAGSAARQASSAARVAARRGGERASQLARRGRESVGDMAQQTQNQFDRLLIENPLALGLAALAVGVVVGVALPATEAENQYLGETRDQLFDRARNLAQETAREIQNNVEQFAQNVKDQATQAAQGNQPPA